MSFEQILLVPGFDDYTPPPNMFENLFSNPIQSGDEGDVFEPLFEIEDVE